MQPQLDHFSALKKKKKKSNKRGKSRQLHAAVWSEGSLSIYINTCSYQETQYAFINGKLCILMERFGVQPKSHHDESNKLRQNKKKKYQMARLTSQDNQLSSSLSERFREPTNNFAHFSLILII